MKLRTSYRALAAVFALVACSDSTTVQSVLLIETDRDTYYLGTSDGPVVQVAIRNTSDRTVTLSACGMGGNLIPVLEQGTNDGWQDATLGSCALAEFEPLDLEPGESITTQVRPLAIGTYRVRVPLFKTSTSQTVSPEKSAPFDVD